MKKIIQLGVILISTLSINAQIDGTIDTSFLGENNGQKGVNGFVETIVEQADGKLIIGGGFDTYNQVLSPKLVRVNADGSLDTSFNQTLLRDSNSSISSILIQPDGKILVAGDFEMKTPFPDNELLEEDIMRLNADGTRDLTFIAPENTSSCGDIRKIALQPDGKILIVGDVTYCVGSTIDNNENILRLNTDGSLDTSFTALITDTGFGFSEEPINSISVQPDGKILIAGNFNEVNGIPQLRLARLNTDGSLDTTYTVGSGFNSVINDIKLQPDGKLIVAGDFTEYNAISLNQIVRLNTDGSLDTTFNSGNGVGRFQPSNSFTAPKNIEHVNLQSDGKILIGGDYNRYNGNVVSRFTRLNSDGTLDTSFYNVDDLGIVIDLIYTSSILQNGDFVIGGTIDKHNNYRKSGIIKLASNGVVDLSFNAGHGPNYGYFDTKVFKVKKGSGNKLYVSGLFREYDDVFSRNIARINADGSIDTSFSTGADSVTNGFDDEVLDLVELADGTVIVVGEFENYNGTPAPGIIGLNSDGSVNTTFNIGIGVDVANSNRINTIEKLQDGKFLVGGFFLSFNGFTTRNLARLNSDGSVDTTFSVSNASQIYDIFLLDNGQFLLPTFSYNGDTITGRLAKINADGTRDLTFTATGISTGSTNVVKELSNGQFLVGGFYSSQGPLLKLNADGSLDATFVPDDIKSSSNSFGTIEDFVFQADGKIIIAGKFNEIENRVIRGVGRLESTGLIDLTFNPENFSEPDLNYGTDDFTNTIYDLELKTSGQLILCGDFRSYNDEPKAPLIALFAGNAVPGFINIPDPNFEQALIDLGIDTDGIINGQMIETDALGVTDLDVSSKNISDLTGIEFFADLENLSAFNNNLSSVNLTQNAQLILALLAINNLSDIDFSNNPNLTSISLNNNNLSSLDLSNNLSLTQVFANQNSLTSIDVSFLSGLINLGVTNNVLENLDVSQNENLITLFCNDNQLNNLNVQNGNNTNFTNFEAQNNSNLTCIAVDDDVFSNSNWLNATPQFNFDAQTTFSLDCTNYINIPDPNFEQALINLGIDTDGIVNTQVREDDIIDVVSLNVSSSNISDLTGIESFLALDTLFAFGNNLTTIDLSNNTGLNILVLTGNNLTEIDLSANTGLVSLDVSQNQLTEIDLSANTLISQLSIENNAIVELDLSQNPALTYVNCSNNDLFNFNMQNGSNTLILQTDFNSSLNPNLACIQVDDVNYSNSTWTNKDTLTNFSLNCSPTNDDCSFATSITLGQTTPGSTQGATSSNFSSSCEPDGIVYFDVWYQFEAPLSGSVTMTLSAGTAVGNAALFESCNATNPLACAEGELQVDNLISGQTYYIQVWLEASSGGRNSSQTQTGAFTINVQDSSVLSTETFEIEQNQISMFPNPAKNKLTLSSKNKINSIQVFDVTGKRIIENTSVNSNSFNLNTSKLSKGLYLVQVKQNAVLVTKKLIIN